jgi:hypothetical protein
MLYLNRQGCTLYSKRGNQMTRFQGLVEQVRAELGRREVVLDGGNIEDRADHIDRKLHPPGDWKEGTVIRYRHLTQGSHPGPRTNVRQIDRKPGQVTIGPGEANPAQVLWATAWACDIAALAFHFRERDIH